MISIGDSGCWRWADASECLLVSCGHVFCICLKSEKDCELSRETQVAYTCMFLKLPKNPPREKSSAMFHHPFLCSLIQCISKYCLFESSTFHLAKRELELACRCTLLDRMASHPYTKDDPHIQLGSRREPFEDRCLLHELGSIRDEGVMMLTYFNY